MTEVANPPFNAPLHPQHDSISALEKRMSRETPSIEMIPNPTFSFPMKPVTPISPESSTTPQPSEAGRRPSSMYMLQQSLQTDMSHKRTASALPTFSFNAGDTSGRPDNDTPPQTPDDNAISSANSARRGHKRGGSEFVGGDSRFGVSSAISSSPTKANMTEPVNLAPARRSHAHRRSVAVSSHDLSDIMSKGELAPRLSSSLPTSPMDMPVLDAAPVLSARSSSLPLLDQSLEDPADDSPVRPPSRPRVEFVEQVEIIPRPLSTISSETESSQSTVRGHSVNNSINSVISMTNSSPATPRNRGTSVSESPLASIAERSRQPRTSSEISKRVEREGEWLKSGAQRRADVSPLRRTVSNDQTLHFADGANTTRKRQKRQTLSHSLGFDRRRSEPSISAAAAASDASRFPPLPMSSSQNAESSEPSHSTDVSPTDKRFSSHKLKQWAMSKLHRKVKDDKTRSATPSTDTLATLDSPETVDVPGKISLVPLPVAETDLDAVFGAVDMSESPQRSATSPTQIAFEVPPISLNTNPAAIDLDEASPFVDLDAASAASSPIIGQRRQLHSDRPTRASATQNTFIHRRAESEPLLTSFDFSRANPQTQKSMEDVFEEDEEDEHRQTNEETGMGITIVDSDQSAFGSSDPNIQRLRQSNRPPDRPSTSPVSSRLSAPMVERPGSIVEDVIVEEQSPVDRSIGEIEIVHAHEEPRAASLEKSSDSSEASTLHAAPMLAFPDGDDSMTSSTLQSSPFSPPDFARRQGSFDASRAGTSASSIADTRTTSSCTTGDISHDVRMSVDDVPSLTSSRSTMLSTSHANSSRRDITDPRTYEAIPRNLDPAQVAARRKNRASIQSLSHLVGFGSKKTPDETRPQTATLDRQPETKRKENRLKKLMFWRSKQSLRQAALDDAQASV